MDGPGFSPQDRARAYKLIDTYRERLGDGTAEPREEFLARHEDLRELLQPLLDRTLSLTVAKMISRSVAETPEQVGPYRILDVLGEGGMGTVYIAEQKDPVRRRVALKVIKLGMDSKEVLARFEAERQALAMMEHDSIAKVLDAGTTERGQPYFAMEHVPGLPITDYCDKHRVGTQDRLKLFQMVCSGVQHAHQKGVIHRDLKPSNILVTEHQGRAVPKIIDFGVAKATDHRLTEATIFTTQGQVIGTPEYMSPEQAEMTSADIDTRTDIYSLGVILYELLVGELPFSSAELRKAGLLEIQRKIREDEPPKPSTRLTGQGDESRDNAQRRQTTVAALMRELRGDLDWIVMRTLEKDRNRRYPTPVGLAEDLERYLNYEPVLAGPPSVTYRMKKFVRKYRAQVVGATLLLVAVIAVGIGTAVFAVMLGRSAELARNERDRAEELANFMLFDLRERLEPLGRLDLLEDVALKAKTYYESSPVESLVLQASHDFATALVNVGDVLFSQGKLDEALSSFQSAVRIQTELVATDPNHDVFQTSLALGNERIGDTLLEQGQPIDALSRYQTSLAIHDRLSADDPSDLDMWHRLSLSHQKIGDVHVRQGDLSGALERFETSLEIDRVLSGRDPGNTAWKEAVAFSHNRIGDTRKDRQDFEGAMQSYQSSLEIRRGLTQDPTDASWQRDLAVGMDNIGVMLLLQEKPEEAVPRFRESMEITRRLAEQDPADRTRQRDLSVGHQHVGNALQGMGDRQAALTEYEAALEIDRELAALDPSNATWQGDLAATHNQIGQLYLFDGQIETALPHFQSALETFQSVATKNPTDAVHQRNLAVGHQTLGLVLMELGDLEEAKVNMETALGVLEGLVSTDPSNAAWEGDLAKTHGILSTLLMRSDDLQDALAHCEQGVEILRRLAPSSPGLAGNLVTLENQLAEIRLRIRREPQTPMDHLEMAYILQESGDHVGASQAFGDALVDTDIFGDLGRANLFNAARSAAQALERSEGEVRDRWKERALFWLEADLRLRATLLAEVERRLASGSDARAELEASRERGVAHFERVQSSDPDLAPLRKMPEFRELLAIIPSRK